MRTKDPQKEKIIREKAIAMIVEEGFDGLSMSKLAKAANISASTIYIYFENRENLLNRLYQDVEERFEKEALRGFVSSMNFEEGLWLQWKNRYNNIKENPLEFSFYEQYRNSPLIKKNSNTQNTFRIAMDEFLQNAIKTKETIHLPIEIWWAVAFGPFYTLIKFDSHQRSMAGNSFVLDELKLRLTFDTVIKSLRLQH
jgi:TetR/AcrR family transcriptional repressor of multidrug resistance operon